MEKNLNSFLFLDDCREPKDSFYYTYNKIYNDPNWNIVRSYDEFVQYITIHGLPSIISFDHDLADEHYETDNIEDYTEKTGYECAKWLVNYCIDNNCKLPIYYCHSQNPVGKKNILTLLENYNKHENK